MVNNEALNSITINEWIVPFGTVQDLVVFNWFGLCNSTYCVQMNNYRNIADIDLQTFIAPQTDWWGVLGKFYQQKTISFVMAIKAATKSELNEKIDILKYETSKTEWLLEITVDWVVRVAKATVTDLTFPRIKSGDTTIWDINIAFKTVEPHFYLKKAVGVSYTNITNDLNEEITNNGTAKTNPIFYFLFKTWIATLSSVAITVWGFTITVAETITDTDVLIINWEDKEVMLNSVVVDYTGVFPELAVWSNPINFVFSPWATFDVDISTIYKQKYL